MTEYYLVFVGVLLILAVLDLVVGVSNDAVNFLNSAIGSRVATARTILIVASVGVFIGASFSSGLMEVARSGIFNPQHFTFAEVIVIFAAVMLADIVLLDMFNTMGMPTSTTVSIVFELLGAAFAVSLFKIAASGGGSDALALYINSGRALGIVSGIFVSVGIAFVTGLLAQYLSRLLFSFQYEKRLPYVGGLWAGLSLTGVCYFLLMKGFKGASFVSDSFLAWVNTHTWSLLIGMFVVFTIGMQLLFWMKVNGLRVVVLTGMFALAMAFAGNDLVNFIGVPIAGLESFIAWNQSGVAADAFLMDSLQQPVRTNTWLLLTAGLVMVLTLWFSRKARTVTETEVSLGRQGEGVERFAPNPIARSIVRGAREIAGFFSALIPGVLRRRIDRNFERPAGTDDPDAPAFDLVRASVNLTLASILIAMATSLKLPLSTTYVTFMVAMGASLADRAWDRDTAVFRVSGVLNVIGGWLITAVVALLVAGLFAFVLHYGGMFGLVGLIALAGFMIWRSNILHREREEEAVERRSVYARESLPVEQVFKETGEHIVEVLDQMAGALQHALTGLVKEDSGLLKKTDKKIKRLIERNEGLGDTLPQYIRRVEEEETSGSKAYIAVYDYLSDMLRSCRSIVYSCRTHIDNSHKPLSNNQHADLDNLFGQTIGYLHELKDCIARGEWTHAEHLVTRKDEVLAVVELGVERQVAGIKARKYNEINTGLYFTLLLETKDFVLVSGRLLGFFESRTNGEEPSLIAQPVA
ncbi:MAG: inorganic phosphate transporter [Rhodothermales bacterium]